MKRMSQQWIQQKDIGERAAPAAFCFAIHCGQTPGRTTQAPILATTIQLSDKSLAEQHHISQALTPIGHSQDM